MGGMAAETLKCPMCGASASTESTRCDHCGARLATVACPSCFGMMFLGSKYCSHCGARADRAVAAGDTAQNCPRCRTRLDVVAVGGTQLNECPRCEGLWADASSFEQICRDREQQAAVLGMATTVPEPAENAVETQIRYLPCPVCKKLMNRVNFAHCSQVIVDVCKAHGTWFDKDELRRIVEFIRSGGLEAARTEEIKELEERRRQLQASKIADAWDSRLRREVSTDEWGSGISAARDILKLFLR